MIVPLCMVLIFFFNFVISIHTLYEIGNKNITVAVGSRT